MYEWTRRWGLSFEMNTLMLPVGVRAKSLLLFTALAGIAATPGLAQTAPTPGPARPGPAVQAPRPVAQPPVAPNAGAATAQPQAVPAPAPAPLPPPLWDLVNAEDLLHYIQQIGVEGLNPADYDPDGLATAI